MMMRLMLINLGLLLISIFQLGDATFNYFVAVVCSRRRRLLATRRSNPFPITFIISIDDDDE